ncbi:MAG: hypothetical protein ACRDN9_15020 [Streptosporangiaceae bacterium]
MSKRTKYAIAGTGAGIIALWVLPVWIAVLIIVGIIGVPVAGYLMLDPSQKHRLSRLGRKQLGR